MVVGVRRGIEVVEEKRMKMEGLMTRVIKIGGEEWRMVGVYINGDLEEK